MKRKRKEDDDFYYDFEFISPFKKQKVSVEENNSDLREYTSYLNKSRSSYDSKDYKSCSDSLFFLINNHNSIKNRAITYYIMNEYQLAINDFEYYLKNISNYNNNDVGNLDVRNKLAICYLKVGNFNMAIYYLTSIINECINNTDTNNENVEIIEYFLNRGIVYFEMKEYQLAINDLNNYLFVKDKDDSVYNYRSACFYYLKQYQKSIEDLNLAIQYNNDGMKKVYIKNRATAFYFLEEYGKAIEDFSVYLSYQEFAKFDYISLHNRGKCYERLKDFRNAIHNYDLALNIDGTDINILKSRGKSYFQMKKFEKAFDDFTDIIVTNFENEHESYFWRAQCFIECKKISFALDDIDKAIEIKKLPIYYALKAHCFLIVNEFEKAIPNFNIALKLEKYNDQYYYIDDENFGFDFCRSRILNNLGFAYNEVCDLENSKCSFSEAIKMNPNKCVYNENLGDCLYQMEDFGGAVEYYRRAVIIDKYTSKCYQKIGVIKGLFFQEFSRSFIDISKAIGLVHGNDEVLSIIQYNNDRENIFQYFFDKKVIKSDFYEFYNDYSLFSFDQ